MKKLRFIILATMLLGILLPSSAQQTAEDGTVYVQSLFTYPVAPDYLDNLEARSDWLMDNFWNDMDFKNKKGVNQAALQHAFGVYAGPMLYAKKAKVLNSVENLCKKAEKNPTLMIQLMKAAEEEFHSQRSTVYIDEVYRIFLNRFLGIKKIKKERKAKYAAQLAALDATEPGKPFPQGESAVTLPAMGSRGTVVIFGNTADDHSRQMLLRFATSVRAEQAVSSGDFEIVFIDKSVEPAMEMPSYIKRVYCEKPQQSYDLPFLPDCYLLDKDGVIVMRNKSIADVLNGAGIQL